MLKRPELLVFFRHRFSRPSLFINLFLNDQRLVIGSTEIDPEPDLCNHLIRKFWTTSRHVRIARMSDKLVKQTVLGIADEDGWPSPAAAQKPFTLGQIQLALGFLAAVTAHAAL